MNCITLASELRSDDNGVPVEWTLLKAGETSYTKEGIDGKLFFTEKDLSEMLSYHEKKGEEIPVDSEHFLFALASGKGMEESEVLKLFPTGGGALGFGRLFLAGNELKIKVKWLPAAYPFLKEKIYKYFSPVIRGLENGPLRLTSVAMTNTPAINNLDAIAASGEPLSDPSDKSDRSDKNKKEKIMERLQKALSHLLGSDSVALTGEITAEQEEKIAEKVEEKASTLKKILSLLSLPETATAEEILAALKAEIEKAATADEKQQELDTLAATAEKEAHARLVAKGRRERKIVEADMAYVNSLDSKALSAYLDHTSPKYPAPLDHGKVEKREEEKEELTPEDRLAIETLKNAGIPDAEKVYLEQKRKDK